MATGEWAPLAHQHSLADCHVGFVDIVGFVSNNSTKHTHTHTNFGGENTWKRGEKRTITQKCWWVMEKGRMIMVMMKKINTLKKRDVRILMNTHTHRKRQTKRRQNVKNKHWEEDG